MAKEIAMVENNEKGREIRRYLIKLEEAWNTPAAVMARAKQMSVISQPEPEKPWSYYPFFEKPGSNERLKYLLDSYDKGLISREEFRQEVLYRETFNVVKANLAAPNESYSKAVAFLSKSAKDDWPDIARFVDTAFEKTGSRTDILLVREIYKRYAAQTENPVSRSMLTRRIRRICPEIGYKQKRINGSPELIFYGVKFKN
jgi:hypothetical protein